MQSISFRGREALLIASLAAGGALALAAAAQKLGFAALLLPVALVAAALLLARPGLTLGLLVSLIVICEADPNGFLPGANRLYDSVAFGITGVELVFILATFGLIVDVTRRRDLRLPAPFTPALFVLALAIVAGAVTGLFAGVAVSGVLGPARVLLFLLVTPVLVVNVLRDPAAVRRALALMTALAIFKAAEGIISVALGVGTPIENGLLTFYEPTANFLMMVFLLATAAALLMRRRLPWWMLGATPLVFAALLLSYRRSFWIGTIAGLAVVVLLGSGRFGRRVIVPAVAAIVLGVVLALNVVTEAQAPTIARGNSTNPLIQRIESVNLSGLQNNAEDRYRIAERENVMDAIASAPIGGLGLGVPWPAPHPLSLEHRDGRSYVHFDLLWFWLKLGILGLAGYLLLFGTSLVTSYRVWKTHPDGLVRASGLALIGAIVGLTVAETTAAFTGVDPRMTILVGALVGGLAAASAQRPPEGTVPP